MSKDYDSHSSNFLLGVGIGAVLGVLFAPRPGKETRERLKKVSEEALEKGKESLGEVQEGYEEVKEKVEPAVQEVIKKVSPYLEAVAELSEPYRNELAEEIKSLVEDKVGKQNIKKVKRIFGGVNKSA